MTGIEVCSLFVNIIIRYYSLIFVIYGKIQMQMLSLHRYHLEVIFRFKFIRSTKSMILIKNTKKSCRFIFFGKCLKSKKKKRKNSRK